MRPPPDVPPSSTRVIRNRGDAQPRPYIRPKWKDRLARLAVKTFTRTRVTFCVRSSPPSLLFTSNLSSGSLLASCTRGISQPRALPAVYHSRELDECSSARRRGRMRREKGERETSGIIYRFKSTIYLNGGGLYRAEKHGPQSRARVEI